MVRMACGAALCLALIVPDFIPASPASPTTLPAPDEYRLSRRLDLLSVHAVYGKKRLRLERRGSAFYHPALPNWNWVGPRLTEIAIPRGSDNWNWIPDRVAGKARESCLWVHPVNEGILTLSFAGVPRGGRLRGFVYFLRSAARDAAVEITIRQGTGEVKRLKPPATPGKVWEFAADIPGEGEGGLDLVVKGLNRRKNHICLDAEIGAAR